MAFDTKAWLTELGFGEAEIGELLPKFESRGEALEKGQLRQAEFSRQLDKLTREFDEKNQKLDQEMAEWSKALAEGRGDTDKLRERANTAERDMLAMRQRLTAFAETNGLDPKTILPDGPAPAPKPEPSPTPALPDNVLTLDKLLPLMDFTITLPAELSAIQTEHQRLFGQPLDPREIVAEIRTRAAKKQDISPRAIWEEKFNVPAKRLEVAKTEHDAEIKAAEDRGYQRHASEAALPGQPLPGRHAPVLVRPEGAAGPKLTRPSAPSRIASAAEALNSHRYRPDAAAGSRK